MRTDGENTHFLAYMHLNPVIQPNCNLGAAVKGLCRYYLKSLINWLEARKIIIGGPALTGYILDSAGGLQTLNSNQHPGQKLFSPHQILPQ